MIELVSQSEYSTLHYTRIFSYSHVASLNMMSLIYPLFEKGTKKGMTHFIFSMSQLMTLSLNLAFVMELNQFMVP